MDDSGSDGEENPLIKAAKACDLDALRRALAEGCDVNYRDPDNGGYSHQQGWSALHHLCSSTYDSEPKQQRLAGARIPTLPHEPYAAAALPSYLTAVAAAGGFARYERAHRTKLAEIFIPKFPQLPKEIVHHILPFWADVGGR